MSASSPVTDRVVATSPGSPYFPEKEADKAAVRMQLDRLLANPSFRNSKRYPALLRFAVERVLEGHTDSLKERTLGIEVFHRDPNYDTNQDPVVRTTAVEVRKRLAQYYQDPAHEAEVRIEFPSGSYLPEFRLPAITVPDEAPPARFQWRLPVSAWVYGAAGTVALAAALLWWGLWGQPTALDRFWSPVWSSSDHVLLCMGGMADSSPASTRTAQTAPDNLFPSPEDLLGADQGVPLAEASAAARIVSQKAAKGRTFRLRSHAGIRFVDLRDGPVVMIGGFDNSWTVRLLDELRLRYHLEREGAVAWIGDRQNPGRGPWQVDTRSTVTRDYAVISRFFNPGTGKETVSIAGLLPFGTGAAGEFLSEPRYLQSATAALGKSWQNKNLQIVIGTRVSGSNYGAPEVLAVYSSQ